MNDKVEKALLNYVTEQHLTHDSKMAIYVFCKNQPHQNRTVYRAHKTSKEIRSALWFSTSKNKDAVVDFAGPECCTFTIHLHNVPVIDINEVLQHNKIKRYMDEEEVIVLGGGIFYRDSLFLEEGFLETGIGNFECWYKMDVDTLNENRGNINTENENENIDKTDTNNENMNKIERALHIIPEEEYEMIDTIDDINVDIPLTEEEKEEILIQIKERQKYKGGSKTKQNRKPKTKQNKTKQKNMEKIKRKTIKRKIKTKNNKKKNNKKKMI